MRPGRSCGTVDSTGVLPPDPTALSGISARGIPVASSEPSVQWHRHCCLCAFAEPGTRPIADADASLACISSKLTLFACPEPRRAQSHPRNPFPATRHSLAQRRNAADEGPLTTEFLIANLELEFRLTHRKLSPLKISNRKKIAISYRVFRRSAKTVLPPSFPSGRGFIPSVTDRGNTSVPLVYPEDAPRRRRALIHLRKPFMVFLSSKKNATSTCPLPLALTHLRKPSPFFPFWHDAASPRSRSEEFLIANARLEFAVSHSKEGPLKIPNRERIAISNRI